MAIPSYRKEELEFAKRKLRRKIEEYKKNLRIQSTLPVDYPDIQKNTESLDAETRTLYDLKKAGKHEEIARIALEYFKNGDEKNGEKYLATLYANSPEHFESISRKLQQLGIHYPVFESRESLIRHG